MSYKSLLYERSSGAGHTDGAAVLPREEGDRTITWDNGGTENTRPMSGAPALTTYFARYSLLFPLNDKRTCTDVTADNNHKHVKR